MNWRCFSGGSPKSSATAWSTTAWSSTASPPTAIAKPPTSRWRAWVRIAGLAALFLICLPPHLIEKVLHRGESRWPRLFLAAAARIAGVAVRVEGDPLRPHSFVVANHTSWLDILIMGGVTGTAFVSKAEVASTPLIGWLADQNRTLYIARQDRGDAHGQVRRIAEALAHPQPLTVFPEGTTGNGRALLPFRSTLLHAVAPPPVGAEVRPVGIDYLDAVDDIAWTDGERGIDNVLRVLGRRGRQPVIVRLLDALPPNSDRKALAREASKAIEAALSSVNRQPRL
jgi:1-acyl-sn-glycerol-3-phosphate acyltransferase